MTHFAQTLLASPSTLDGCTNAAAEALTRLQIHSVFDLGMSAHFRAAVYLVDEAPNRSPADLIDDQLLDTPGTRLADQPIEALDGIGEAYGALLRSNLGISTLEDMATWPPFVAARAVVAQALHAADEDGSAPSPTREGIPDELVPQSGTHATEKRRYQRIFLHPKPQHRQDSELQAPLSLSDTVGADARFGDVAFGAVLTFEQTWTPKEVALGQLLHSLALAPAEMTKVAIVDWSRTTSAELAETASQVESLSNRQSQSRAVGEVADATAREVQQGSSSTDAFSHTSQAGASASGPGFGLSLGSATSYSRAKAVSSSYGERSVTASSLQQITAASAQHASSARSRRAAIVQEVRETESETVSTRIVANYNHSHALSVHYYEVIQMYEARVRLVETTRCIFLPMELVDFRNPAIYQKYGALLQRSAIGSPAGALIDASTATTVAGETSESYTQALIWPSDAARATAQSRGIEYLRIPRSNWTTTGFRAPVDAELVNIEVGVRQLPSGQRLTLPMAFHLLKFDGTSQTIERAHGVPGAPLPPIKLADIREIRAAYDLLPDAATASESIELAQAAFPGAEPEDTFPVFLVVQTPTGTVKLEGAGSLTEYTPQSSTFEWMSVSADVSWQTILSELDRDPLGYSQLVWMGLDDSDVALMLRRKTLNGVPLLTAVDPRPVTVFGNYLVLRYYGEDEAWLAWKDKHVDEREERVELIPLPTGGVFAEAILGRANASEKLDITRFWNWQDSPIPHMGPEIAPIGLGSRAQEVSVDSPRLDAPMIQITQPPPLPDPQGMAGVLQVLAASNLFRDMSGLQEAAALARQGLVTTGAGAAHGASTALDALKAGNEFGLKAMGMLTGAGTGGTKMSPNSTSYTGAMLNHARTIDNSTGASTVPSQSRTGTTGQTGGSSAPTTPGSGGGTGGSTSGPSLERVGTAAAMGVALPSPPSSTAAYEEESGPMLAAAGSVPSGLSSSDFYTSWMDQQKAGATKAVYKRDSAHIDRLLQDLNVDYPVSFKTVFEANHLAYANVFFNNAEPSEATFGTGKAPKSEGSTYLDPNGKNVINGLVALTTSVLAPRLGTTPQLHADVVGMASSTGTKTENDTFASRRAIVTRDALQEAIAAGDKGPGITQAARGLLLSLKLDPSPRAAHLGAVDTALMLGGAAGQTRKGNVDEWQRAVVLLKRYSDEDLYDAWVSYVSAWANKDRDSKDEIMAWMASYNKPIVDAVLRHLDKVKADSVVSHLYPSKTVAAHQPTGVAGFDPDYFAVSIQREIAPAGQAFWLGRYTSWFQPQFGRLIDGFVIPALYEGVAAFEVQRKAFSPSSKSQVATFQERYINALDRNFSNTIQALSAAVARAKAAGVM